jgi:hypothetical protein
MAFLRDQSDLGDRRRGAGGSRRMWVGFSASEIESTGNLKGASLREKHLKKESTTFKQVLKEGRSEQFKKKSTRLK